MSRSRFSARFHRDGHRHFDLIGLLCRGAEVVVVIFPVEAGRGGAAIGEPVQRDVVEYFVATNHAFGAAIAVAPFGDRTIRLRGVAAH